MSFRADASVRTELFDQPGSAQSLPSDLVAGLYDKFHELPTQFGNEVDVASLGFGTNPLWFDSATDVSTESMPKELLVANLHPNDNKLEELSPFEQPAELILEQEPEVRLQEIMDSFPENPTNADYDKAVPEVKELLDEQSRITDAASDEYRNYGGIEDLLGESDEHYRRVVDSLPPQLANNQAYMDMLSNVHVLAFSGHEVEAKSVFDELKKGAGVQGTTALQDYYDQLNKTARENPEIIGEYSVLVNKFFEEWNTAADMVRLLDKHTLGDFIE